MSQRMYRHVLEWAHHAGVVTAFFSLIPTIWFAVRVVGFPRPGSENAGQMLMVVAVIGYFFTAAFVYGKLAMKIAQCLARFDCPQCGQQKASLDLGPFWRPPFKVDTLLNQSPTKCMNCLNVSSS